MGDGVRLERGNLGFWLTAFVALWITAAPAAADVPTPVPDPPPNIVLVIGDDHGYPDFGFMGSEIVQTPNLDRLAAGGSVYRVGYNTASVCLPSLRTLLTGLHPYQWIQRTEGLSDPESMTSGRNEVRVFDTLPDRLTEVGYQSFQDGKHWEGSYADAGFTGGTKTRAFFGPNPMRRLGPRAHLLARITMIGAFSFINRTRGSPFFLWFAPLLPHVPFDADPVFERPYENFPPLVRGYYANITRFDGALGELLAHLEKRGLREQTLVVYLSDNGWDPTPTPTDGLVDGPRGKTSLYDLGFRTPVIFSWPGHVPAGRVSDDLVSTVDVVATLLDYAGASATGLPGKSLRPAIEGRAPWTREWVAGILPAGGPGSRTMRGDRRGRTASFVRDARWHYIAVENPKSEELYDVSLDPMETRDVTDQHADVVARMRERIQTWKTEMSIVP